MMKSSLILLGALLVCASFSPKADAQDATIAVESTPLKVSGSPLSKSLTELKGGMKVKKLGQRGDWVQIEVTDESGNVQTGYVQAAKLTTGPSALGSLGKGDRVSLGAAGKGKPKASANALDGMLDVAGNENAATDDILGADDAGLEADTGALAAAPKTPSNKALDHLDTVKISDAEIMAFMKAGGLKSRLMK